MKRIFDQEAEEYFNAIPEDKLFELEHDDTSGVFKSAQTRTDWPETWIAFEHCDELLVEDFPTRELAISWITVPEDASTLREHWDNNSPELEEIKNNVNKFLNGFSNEELWNLLAPDEKL